MIGNLKPTGVHGYGNRQYDTALIPLGTLQSAVLDTDELYERYISARAADN